MKSSTRGRFTRYQALAEFRYQLRRFLRVSEDAAREAGLQPQQHQLLLAVKGAPAGQDVTVAYLAERLQIKHHSVVGLIDRLVRRGAAARHRDPADRRRAFVDLTTKGEALLHHLSLFHEQEIRSQAPALLSAMTSIVGRRPKRAAPKKRGSK
jgi:DNA-binding MarR family transcriptional regulator